VSCSTPASPTTDTCRGHWYSEQVADAEDRYRPLIDAIAAATGLGSYVWQSGGMTMTLVTPFQAGNQEPYEGDRYLTLVEGWPPTAGWKAPAGSTRPATRRAPRWCAMPSYAASAAVFRTTITAEQWAVAIADHYQEFLRTTREGGKRA
jgi:hypothetical protein